MTKFDEIFVPLAKKLVNETFGFSATLRRLNKTYDATTGVNGGSPIQTDYSVMMSPPSPFNRRRYPDVQFEDRDMMTILAADGLSIVPHTQDQLVYGGTTWQVVAVFPMVSGEETAAYRLQLRQ